MEKEVKVMNKEKKERKKDRRKKKEERMLIDHKETHQPGCGCTQDP